MLERLRTVHRAGGLSIPSWHRSPGSSWRVTYAQFTLESQIFQRLEFDGSSYSCPCSGVRVDRHLPGTSFQLAPVRRCCLTLRVDHCSQLKLCNNFIRRPRLMFPRQYQIPSSCQSRLTIVGLQKAHG